MKKVQPIDIILLLLILLILWLASTEKASGQMPGLVVELHLPFVAKHEVQMHPPCVCESAFCVCQ